jgi:hypothetical protein
MSHVPLVMYGRQPWRRAVEEEIHLQLNRGATDIDRVVMRRALTRRSGSASTRSTFSKQPPGCDDGGGKDEKARCGLQGLRIRPAGLSQPDR